MNRIITMAEWLYELLVLQALWIIYIFRGILIMGFFPATAAVYAITRNWIRKSEKLDTIKTFKEYYHEYFRNSNILGWSFLLISGIVMMNFLYIPYYSENALRIGMYGLLIFLGLILLSLWSFLFPVLVHFDIKRTRDYALAMVKTALYSPLGLILQLLLIGIYSMCIYLLPPLIIVFGVIPLALIQLGVTLNIFRESGNKTIKSMNSMSN
ncbi:hypothetical protein CR203_14150 [Salipaludibacillus neizhouensis]|uniref:DUF624 domain-containing protein n=1 Tax=Salipaludibacillus neizhouensis TaxID=885475 RepID=A0A3A9KBK4_9BACI|nr:DUF624 domain-containing protein [Salipaludibacillus neizhouensis]RKL66963.1 hypothetical protein CR203_14150 [Salipaludibacillus neizhouensis]